MVEKVNRNGTVLLDKPGFYTYSLDFLKLTDICFQLKSPGVTLKISSRQKVKRNSLKVRLKVLHCQPDTHSELDLRTVLEDSSLDLESSINLLTGTIGSTTDFQHKSLLVGRNSNVRSVPAMNISENSVKASHGVTVAKYSNEEVFYLMSRGISKNQAKSVLMEAFLA